MKRKNYQYVIVFVLLLFSQSAFSQSQVLDDESRYIIVEGDVVDSVKLQLLLQEKREKVNNTINNISPYLKNIERLIEIGRVNGKITDNNLYEQALKIYDGYIRFKSEIIKKSDDRQWRSSNIGLIDAATKLKKVEGEFNITGKTNEQKVETMLKKQKVSELFVPYLEQLLLNTKDVVQSIKRLGMELAPEEMPYKKGQKRILNPYNRNYWYVNNKRYLDTLDLKMQLGQWEWWNTEQYEKTYTAYPRSMYYYSYKSHPEYKVIGDKVFSSDGDLICQVGLLREDEQILNQLKNELLKTLYINDYKSNKYDILKAPAKTQEYVKIMLGLPFKSSLDANTAKKNKKVIDDYYKTQVDEIKASNGSWQQRERARVKANNAKMKMGALMLDQMLDKDYNAANNFKEQIEKDHKYDLYEIYKITRVNNTSFKVAYMNNQNKSSYTGLVTIKQKGKFQWEYTYKLVPNDQTIEVDPSDYPRTTMYDLNGNEM